MCRPATYSRRVGAGHLCLRNRQDDESCMNTQHSIDNETVSTYLSTDFVNTSAARVVQQRLYRSLILLRNRMRETGEEVHRHYSRHGYRVSWLLLIVFAHDMGFLS